MATGHCGVSISLVDSLLSLLARLRVDANLMEDASVALKETIFVEKGEGIDIDMGAIVANSRVAIWLLKKMNYKLKPGEALPLMSHNALGIVSAARFLLSSRSFLQMATLGSALSMHAFHADLSPFSQRVLDTLPKDTEASKAQVNTKPISL